VDVPLPWERLLWSRRPLWPRGTRYALTDFRLVADAGSRSDEIALQDIGDVQHRRGALDILLGTSTLVVNTRRGHRPPFLLSHVRRGQQLGALLELLAGETDPAIDAEGVRAALAWTPGPHRIRARGMFMALAAALLALPVAIGLRGSAATIIYRPDDAIYPGGRKRSRQAIEGFMESEVMPWARSALGPVVGGPANVTCATCHGQNGADRDWQMPAVTALPAPAFQALGWELYSRGMTPQVRNAIYGYLAESDKQHTAGYMREIVLPGMARLLHRPAYDFTRSYEYNRTHQAFGCYHCHRLN
jgi:hypothetical protein